MVIATPAGRVSVELALIGRVAPLGEVTPIPAAPSGIAGIVDLRGRVVTLLEPFDWLLDRDAVRLEGTDRPGALPTSALLFAAPFEHLALLVPAGSTLEPQGGTRPLRRLDRSTLEARIQGLADRLRTAL